MKRYSIATGVMALGIVLAFSPTVRADNSALVLTVKGMACEIACPPIIESALKPIAGVQSVSVDFYTDTVCVGPADATTAKVARAVLAEHDYTVADARVGTCPEKVVVPNYKGIWKNTQGIDAKVVSTGLKFDLSEARVTDKYTVFDFGAAWCAPCKVVEKKLRAALRENSDLAVRAVDLGPNEKSFDLPVFKQHLSFVPGLPWMIVLSPEGKKIYQGQDPDKALKAIDKAISKAKR